MTGLTRRQEMFVAEFIKDGNATQAAVRAGFSAKGASVQASRLLANVKVTEAIAKLRAPIVEAAGLTLAGHLKALEDLRDAALGAKQFAPAVTAEVSRGKVSGLYVERQEISGADGSPLKVIFAHE